MNKIAVILFSLALLGAGCFGPKPEETPEKNLVFEFEGTTYTSDAYGFSIDYPTNMEMKVRPPEVQDTTYLGIPAKFFVSLRDTVREADPLSIAYFYAAENLTIDAFEAALVASDPEFISVTAKETYSQGGLTITKITSTTAMGENKVHYLVPSGSQMIIVAQMMLEDEAFGPVVQTLRQAETK